MAARRKEMEDRQRKMKFLDTDSNLMSLRHIFL